MSVPHRIDITFVSGGDECAAWFYPGEAAARGEEGVPAVVLAHGLGGDRRMRLAAYAERFAAAGYACLVFDYRGFGDSGGDPGRLDVNRQLADWRAAVDTVRRRPEVDPARVVLWGTSFSGGHVLRLASEDGAVAAVVVQGPFTDGVWSVRAMSVRTAARVTWMGVRDLVGGLTGRRPVMIPVAGEPGTAALMTAADALPGYRALQPPGDVRDVRVRAGVALQIARYRPGTSTGRISAPVWAGVCAADSVAPAAGTRRHLARLRDLELHTYQVGHFDVYLSPAFDRIVASQLEFLRARVPVAIT